MQPRPDWPRYLEPFPLECTAGTFTIGILSPTAGTFAVGTKNLAASEQLQAITDSREPLPLECTA